MSAYRTTEVANVLGLTPHQVRYYVYAGLLSPDRGPGREYRYSFSDLILLRLGQRLSGARIPVRQIRKALTAIQESLEPDEPLASVEVDALGEVVIARDRAGVWDPESGQRYFDFTLPNTDPGAEPGEGHSTVVAIDDWRPAQTTVRILETQGSHQWHGLEQANEEAAEWFDRAADLEDVDPEKAKAAYRRVILLMPGNPDAHANLGRLLYENGNLAEAVKHFGIAFELDSSDATSAYNLGVSFEDLGNPDAALEAYLRAISAEPELASAHFNLSRLYEVRGESAAALRHLAEYKRLQDDH